MKAPYGLEEKSYMIRKYMGLSSLQYEVGLGRHIQ